MEVLEGSHERAGETRSVDGGREGSVDDGVEIVTVDVELGGVVEADKVFEMAL